MQIAAVKFWKILIVMDRVYLNMDVDFQNGIKSS